MINWDNSNERTIAEDSIVDFFDGCDYEKARAAAEITLVYVVKDADGYNSACLLYHAPTETYYALNFGGGYTFRNNYSVPSTKGSFKRAKAAFEKYAGDKLYKG